MEMNEITSMYSELRSAFIDKITEFINNNDGKIILNEKQSKKLCVYTGRHIEEIGIDKDVTNGVYIKGTDGTITSFGIIPFEIQYNIIGYIYEWFYLKMKSY